MSETAVRRFHLVRWVLVAVVVLVVLTVLKTFTPFKLPGLPTLPGFHSTTTTSVEPSKVQAKLVSQQKLQVYDLKLSDLLITQSKAPSGVLGRFWHTDTVLHAYGDVEVTVDWSKAKVSGPDKNGNLTVNLPAPQLSPARVDQQQTHIDNPHCGINIFCHPDVNAIYQAAQIGLQQEATNPKYDLTNKSQAQAETFVRNIVKATGGDPAKINFIWAPNPT